MKTPFLALNGTELSSVILTKIKAMIGSVEETRMDFSDKAAMLETVRRFLAVDQRFEPHHAYPKGEWSAEIRVGPVEWAVEILIDPHHDDNPPWLLRVTGRKGTPVPTVAIVTPRLVAPTPVAPSQADPTPVSDDLVVRTQPMSHHGGEDYQPGAVAPTWSGEAPAEDLQGMKAEQALLERRNQRIIAEAQARGDVVLTDAGEMGKPQAARVDAGMPARTVQKADDGRLYDQPLPGGESL